MASVFPASPSRTMATSSCMTDKWSAVRIGFRKTSAIAESSCRHGLVVRYPIRMKEDLLPVENLSVEKTPSACWPSTWKSVAASFQTKGRCRCWEQLQLKGTLILAFGNRCKKRRRL